MNDLTVSDIRKLREQMREVGYTLHEWEVLHGRTSEAFPGELDALTEKRDRSIAHAHAMMQGASEPLWDLPVEFAGDHYAARAAAPMPESTAFDLSTFDLPPDA